MRIAGEGQDRCVFRHVWTGGWMGGEAVRQRVEWRIAKGWRERGRERMGWRGSENDVKFGTDG